MLMMDYYVFFDVLNWYKVDVWLIRLIMVMMRWRMMLLWYM